MPRVTASPGASVTSPPAARANTLAIREAPATRPRLRDRLIQPATPPRRPGATPVIMAVLLAAWNSA